MIGIIIQLCLSWLIVWIVEKKNLSVLGFYPSKSRLLDFILYFLIAAAFCSLGFVMKMYFGDPVWRVNPDLSASLVMKGVLWNIKSVLFEELIFRGILLYILIKRLGALKAIIVSAVSFGIYHWFSFGVVGSIVPMIVTFLMTGTMGLLLAYGYSKTFSLYIPIGIHLGWNITQTFIFSQGPIGNGVLIAANGNNFQTDSYFTFILITFAPVALALLVSFLLLKNKPQHLVT
jgi:membrane protease YdiL (CAAX protease family)